MARKKKTKTKENSEMAQKFLELSGKVSKQQILYASFKCNLDPRTIQNRLRGNTGYKIMDESIYKALTEEIPSSF